MSRSAATRSAAASRASPRPSPTRRTPRLVLFSYPLHPPGGPERTEARIAHWPAIRCPVLLLSGESDPFARIDLLRASVGLLAERRTGHVPASRAHPQAGPRRRPGPRRCVPRERAGTADRDFWPWSLPRPGDVGTLRPPPGAAATASLGTEDPSSRRRSAQAAAPIAVRSDRQADARRAHRVVPVGRSRIASRSRPPSGGRRRDPRDGSSCVTVAGPQIALAKNPPGLGKFMNAIGQVESGGRYDARNKSSGAYGKYQIMPSNWPAWAKTLPRQRQRQADAREPGEGRGAASSRACTSGSAAGAASPTGG